LASFKNYNTSDLTGALVRLGNFFNSEILGKSTNLPWAVVFDRVDGVARHPVQLYESLAYLLIFLFLFTLYLKLDKRMVTKTFGGLFLFLVFGVRFFLEYFKVEQANYSLNLPFTVGQLLSLPVIIFGFIWMIQGLLSLKEEE